MTTIMYMFWTGWGQTNPSAGTPERWFIAPFRGQVFASPYRGQTFVPGQN